MTSIVQCTQIHNPKSLLSVRKAKSITNKIKDKILKLFSYNVFSIISLNIILFKTFFSHFTCVLSSGRSRSGIVGRWVITTRPVRDGCWGGLCNTSEPPKIQNLDKKKYHQTIWRKKIFDELFISQKHHLQKKSKNVVLNSYEDKVFSK